MKVVVTGGAGFIGHHLVPRLQPRGHQVVVFDNLHRGSFERPELVGSCVVRADVRDFEACMRAFAGASAVIHLAAQSNVMGSEADPEYAYSTNVTGTWNVARAAVESGVDHLIFASSREVYGDVDELPVRETTPLSPKNLYGASKTAGEVLLRQLRGAGTKMSILRLSNVIGPGDSGRVVPLWLERARSHEPLIVFGGSQVLDVVPIDYVCAAILRMLELGSECEPMNIGGGRTTGILELAEHIVRLTGSASAIEIRPARGPEVSRFCADITRAVAELGLRPPQNPLDAIEPDW